MIYNTQLLVLFDEGFHPPVSYQCGGMTNICFTFPLQKLALKGLSVSSRTLLDIWFLIMLSNTILYQQFWSTHWLSVWQHQTITWINVGFPPITSPGTVQLVTNWKLYVKHYCHFSHRPNKSVSTYTKYSISTCGITVSAFTVLRYLHEPIDSCDYLSVTTSDQHIPETLIIPGALIWWAYLATAGIESI